MNECGILRSECSGRIDGSALGASTRHWWSRIHRFDHRPNAPRAGSGRRGSRHARERPPRSLWTPALHCAWAMWATAARLVSALSGVDAVIHCAGYIEVAESQANPRRYFENNLARPIVMLEGMAQAGVDAIVFSSTAAVYGEPETIPILETAPDVADQHLRSEQARFRERPAVMESAGQLRARFVFATSTSPERGPMALSARLTTPRRTSFLGFSRLCRGEARVRGLRRMTIRRAMGPACATTSTCAIWPGPRAGARDARRRGRRRESSTSATAMGSATSRSFGHAPRLSGDEIDVSRAAQAR